jgi:RNA polymerase sigma-70 factor (ECF subfamily)
MNAIAALADADLVTRVKGGDTAAMEALMRRHNRTLFRTARAILHDDAEAEEVVQEAYIQAFRALDGFRGDSSYSTWLVRIVANQALMRRRRNVRRAQVLPIDSTVEDANAIDEERQVGRGPEREAMIGEMRRLLETRIDALPDLYRAVFVLRAVEELTVEETSLALDLPEATVRTRYFRARALLRGSLAADIDHALEDVFGFAGARCDRIVANVIAALPSHGAA